jgi:predicted Zn-dependent peptidase
VKEKEMSLDLSGGLNYFGNEFDYNGPMIMTTRTTYKPGRTSDEIIREMDSVVAEIGLKGVTDKELADAKISYRSNFYNQLESTFGKAHLLSVLALFRDDPNQVNLLLKPFESVTNEQVQTVAMKYLVATNRTIIDRVPDAKAEAATPATGSEKREK